MFRLRLAVVAFILLLAKTAGAATYYVDSAVTDTNVASATADFTAYNPTTFSTSTGSDSVFKTIADVNVKTFSAGDSVLFRRGQTWREMLTVSQSGSSGSPITFGAFGSGALPIINGSDVKTGWAAAGGATPNLLSETFNPTGYDNSWTETVGSGSFVDEDSTTVADSAAGATHIIKIQKVSPNYNAKARYDFGSELTSVWVDAYFYVDTFGTLSYGDNQRVLSGYDASSNIAWVFSFNTADITVIKGQFQVSSGGTITNTIGTVTITMDAWHHIQCKYDLVNNLYEAKLDGAAAFASGSITTTHVNGTRYFEIGDVVRGATSTYYVDQLGVDSAAYVVPGASIANTYSVALTTQPYLVLVDGVWATLGSSSTTLNNGEWFWGSNVLYYKNTTNNPDTLGLVMQAGRRLNAIIGNTNISYISIDSLDLTASNGPLIQTNGGTAAFWRIAQNTLSFASTTGGGAINLYQADDTTVQSNTLTNNRVDAIFVGDDSDRAMVADNIISLVYGVNSDCIQVGGAGTHTGTTITRNRCDMTGTDSTKSCIQLQAVAGTVTYNQCLNGANGIEIDSGGLEVAYNTISGQAVIGAGVGAGIISAESGDNVSVHHNLIYNTVHGIYVLSATRANWLFYNNTVYENSTHGVMLLGTIDGSFKNNIIWASTARSGAFQLNTATIGAGGWAMDNNLIGPEAANFMYWTDNVGRATLAAWVTASGKDANSLSTDPLFATPSAGGFTLRPGSLARDAGVNLGSAYNKGLDADSVWPMAVRVTDHGDFRPRWDLGAYVAYRRQLPPLLRR